MPKHIVFLVHGMGRHFSPGHAQEPPWHQEVEAALDEGWRSLPTLGARERSDYIRFVPLSYDRVFRDYLSDVGDAAAAVRELLPQEDVGAFFDALGDAADDEPGFVWDHVMDVLLYRYGGDLWANVHSLVAKQIVDAVVGAWDEQGEYGTSFSLVCHSLGTAVAHGALNRLGGGSIGGSEAFEVGGDFRLRSYVALANVSRVLWWGEQSLYDSTIVRPSLRGRFIGYVDDFLNVRHAMDPIAAVRRFAPSGWGPRYREVAVEHVRGINPHGFAHHLKSPRVYGAVLESIMGSPYVPKAELEAQIEGFQDVAIADPAKRKAVEDLVREASREIRETFDDDRVVGPTSELIAKAVALLWKHRKALGPWMESGE